MSSSPFTFPHTGSMQSLHEMGVQVQRAEKENPASVRESLLPLIPSFSVQTKTYKRVENQIPQIWQSDTFTVPDTKSEGFDIAFVSMDGTLHLEDPYNLLAFQIMRNGQAVVQCEAQNLWDFLGSITPHQYGMWSGPVSPGDVFSLRAAQTSGDIGTKALSTDVMFSMTSIHFRQSTKE